MAPYCSCLKCFRWGEFFRSKQFSYSCSLQANWVLNLKNNVTFDLFEQLSWFLWRRPYKYLKNWIKTSRERNVFSKLVFDVSVCGRKSDYQGCLATYYSMLALPFVHTSMLYHLKWINKTINTYKLSKAISS